MSLNEFKNIAPEGPAIKLSEKSLKELRAIFEKDFGDMANRFNDKDLNEVGVIFLQLTAFALKRRISLEINQK